MSEQPSVILSSASLRWSQIDAEFLRIPAGHHVVPGAAWSWLGVHFGSPVNADCRCDGHRYRGIQKHGDIDIVPAQLSGSWEDDGDCQILRVKVSPMLLNRVAVELGLQGDKDLIRPALRMRDSRLESVLWAIKSELEASEPSEKLYAESLGVALAVRLLKLGGQRITGNGHERHLSPAQKKKIVDFIETFIDQPLSLSDLAAVVGLGLSQFKILFRNSFDESPHRYLVRRRAERAKALLLVGELSIAQVALESGFAHQSHMTTRMRQFLGVSPSDVVRQRSEK
ncbi:MAG TPA: AraC family transcriptional regulator [Oculatellaceae cyanobacterium]